MFNWTTTTLINEMPFVKIDEAKGTVRIGKHLFEKRWVENIRKANGHSMELCEATLDMETVKTKLEAANASVARLYLYVGLEGSEESIYANDWYRKGMPLSVSFVVADAAVMAAAIVDTVNKFNVFTKVKKVLEVSAEINKNVEGATEATLLKIKGTHEHQRLQKIAILIGDGGMLGEEKTIIDWNLSEARYADTEKGIGAAAYTTLTGVTLVNPGANGFGTYSQLVKDLRLPTAVHNHWLNVQKDEMPIVGATYNQYIINYYAPSTANPSFTAIGNRSMSETTHVFWVHPDAVSEFEAAIAVIDPDAEGLQTNAVIPNKVYNNKKKSLVERVEALEG